MATVRAQEASSSMSDQYAYEVFLSFRGADIRTTFIDHLYTALVNTAGIITFRDDNDLETGENIELELNRAIQQSRISIIVFSKNYAYSRWCLNELVQILERRNSSATGHHTVFPVFYHVDPSHVRHQRGSFADAFDKHEERFKAEMDKVRRWREALKQVADLSGMRLEDGHESKFIQEIVKVIARKVNRTVLNVAPYLIGINSRAKNINLWLRDESTNVSIVVICGMGGVGKTTIAKYVYNLNFERFEGSSFLANIREASKQPNGLVHLQRQLLLDILPRETKEIYNVDEGMIKIQNGIRCKRVFIVFDDVDHVDQLNAILGMRDWLSPGSKIIITTRHEGLLKENEVNKEHKVEYFDHEESLELFSWHAFGQDHPTQAFIGYSRRVVDHCEGLPLALQVLGSSLSQKSVDVWKSAIEKLEVIPNSRILEKLKISYDCLEDDLDQDLFLYIACFFIGEERDFTVKILDECDLYTRVGIQNLIGRCLLTIDESNKLRMHQLLKDMGREIIRQESPKEPGKRSRLWRHKDSFNVLKEKTGTETIEGLTLDMRMIMEDRNNEVNLKTDAFSRMQRLKILQLNCVPLTGSYKEFPKTVRWLHWHGFPLKFLPSYFPLESLVALDLSYCSLERVSLGTKFIGRLKILNLSHCDDLAKTPDFSGLPNNNLDTLILNDCVSLVEVHESIGNLKGLVFLNLKDCKKLRKLPKNIGMLKSLETLDISGCSNLAEFPKEFKKVESLKVLHADGIGINQSLSTTNSRHGFDLFWALLKPRRSAEKFSLAFLPSSLVCLTLSNCNLSDDAFSRDLSKLPQLRELDLSKNPICSLPDWVKGLSSLKMLGLDYCTSLQSLLGLPAVRGLALCGCNSLEKITYQSTSFRLLLFNLAYDKLVEVQGFFKLEPLSKVDVEMINYMGLGLFNLESMGDIEVAYELISQYAFKFPIQGLHEFGIFSTFVPGIEVPDWFSYEKSSGSSISFTVPSRLNLRIRGLNVYFVYTVSHNRSLYSHTSLYIEIINRTKNLKWIYCPICFGYPECNEDMVWLSHWPFGNDQLEGGDQVCVSIIVGIDHYKVKECGINFVYDEEESNPPSKKRRKVTPAFPDEDDEKKSNPPNNTTHISSEQVIGGDLSRYQSRSQSAYFLCHRMYGDNIWKLFAGRSHWTVEDTEGAIDFTLKESSLLKGLNFSNPIMNRRKIRSNDDTGEIWGSA